MIEYIYFVKCPNCEDEPFDFFDEAKTFAMSCLTQKPVITQVEVDRNDFGECTDSHDLGTVWSWEDMMKDMPKEDELTTFSKADTFDCGDDFFNCEFDDDCLDAVPDNFRRPVEEAVSDSTRAPRDSDFVIVSKHPGRNYYSFLGNNLRMTKQLDKAMPYSSEAEAEYDLAIAEEQSDSDRYVNSDQFFITTAAEAKKLLNDNAWRKAKQLSFADMTIEQLVEEMEENEDTVECKVCEELFEKAKCHKDEKLGWVCEGCRASSLTEAYRHLANSPVQAKEHIFDAIKADPTLKGCVTRSGTLSIINVVVSPHTASRTACDGYITDFNIDTDGNIIITLSKDSNGTVLLRETPIEAINASRTNLGYKVLKKIKDTAKELNKTMNPGIKKVRDQSVLAALKNDPAAAMDILTHIIGVSFRIPLVFDENSLDRAGDFLDEAAFAKLTRIQEDFLALPFANSAIACGIVENRDPSEDYSYNISSSWNPVGILKFNCAIKDLSKGARDIINTARTSKEEVTDTDTSKVIHCYRLAVALIRHNGNNPEFFKTFKPEFDDERRNAALHEDTKTTTWTCFFDGKELGTVEAPDEEEAYGRMEQKWPTYDYGMYDGVAVVEPLNETLTEASAEHIILGNQKDPWWGDGDVVLEYDDLYVEYGYGGMVDNDWYSPPEPKHWFSGNVDHTYYANPEDVAVVIFENYMTEEDAKDVPGGLEALAENDELWDAFLYKHFDELVEKYQQQLLYHYEEAAAEDYVIKKAEEDDEY